MPPRKREDNDADSNAQTTPIPAKRQRVSLACDSCRTAREKCDGGRPNCGTCIAQNRTCSYTPASRKRGVQTGYLRTIELSLAWLFEQVPECEGALHRLLTQNDGVDGVRILGTKDKAGHRLYRRWNKSRVHKDIGRFLSEDKTPRTDTSAEDSETEEDTSPATSNLQDGKPSPNQGVELPQTTLQKSYAFRPSSAFQSSTRLILPPNWQRLIEIYFSYTHCWFPIIERDTIMGTALTYPQEGLENRSSSFLSASHAQLWAVLAVAAFQDSASSVTSSHGILSPTRIYLISRSLIPSEDENFETPHICALLLQSLVLLGQRRQAAAWLLIGKASRLALYDRDTTTHMYPNRADMEEASNNPKALVVAASFILDTLASLSLGHPQVPSRACATTSPFTPGDSNEGEEIWNPIIGFGLNASNEVSPQPPQGLSVFQQLSSFCKLWGTSMESRLQDNHGRKINPEDLVRGLNPRFSFCNSLIFGGSTPMIPSAFLLQVMFLTITLDLVPGYRPSLFSNLIEVIESCLENFGPGGTPPIFVTLMEIIQRHGHLDRMHEHDKAKWKKVIDKLNAVWKAEPSESVVLEEHQTTTSYLDAISQPMTGSTFMDELSTTNYQPEQGTSNIPGVSTMQTFNRLEEPKELTLLSYDRQRYPLNQDRSPNTSQSMHAVTPTLTFQSPILQRGQTIPGLHNTGIQDQMVDYDAILEELGSIDCADSLDVDPQFMANLGFAPGCDLGEMFQGDFGI